MIDFKATDKWYKDAAESESNINDMTAISIHKGKLLMNKWINVNDAVPPDDRNVLILAPMLGLPVKTNDIHIGNRVVYKNGKIKWKAYMWCGTTILCTEGKKCCWNVTHWQPLMELPND